MTYAFTFDASACSGCKACQIACKDKNHLPTGVNWRRVYEISGGTWTNVVADGARPGVWETDVFAYNLSIACNHCVHPKCAGVCPVDAYVVRDDGIVYIDESKCMGCGYCAWACPYSAPRYNPELHHMTKCNFCYDNIDAGLPPACVAACPMRVLDFVTVETEDRGQTTEEIQFPSSVLRLWSVSSTAHPFPLPTFSRTEPHLAIKPHAAMGNELEKTIANHEEIRPAAHSLGEMPLIAFTLLAQMAVGAFLWLELLYMALFRYWDVWGRNAGLDVLASHAANNLTEFPLLGVGAALGAAGLASVLHLGTPQNAWRALNHLSKSWLSREILFFGLFGLGWALTLGAQWVSADALREPLAWLTAGLGAALVYAMAQVYRLRAAPAWNTWRSTAGFFVTAALLGRGFAFALLALDALIDPRGGYRVGAFSGAGWIFLILLCAEAGLMRLEEQSAHRSARQMRGGLILLGMAGALALPGLPHPLGAWSMFPLFLIILLQAVLGRWLFYQSRQPVLG